MNKTPQPSGGTPSAPHPSPSPGLPQQSAFPPGQPASVVFNPAQATQMNTPSQPRQFPAGPRAIHQQDRAHCYLSASAPSAGTLTAGVPHRVVATIPKTVLPEVLRMPLSDLEKLKNILASRR
uniref:Uncharacterized protein n=1 Tax=Sphaerodactylus townsendi TaxID=933632 RepID=A0ACB8FBM4_9SAUR